MARTCPFDPPPDMLDRLPAAEVRMPSGEQAWLVSGYELQRSLLADRRLSADPRRPGFPFLSEADAAFRQSFKAFGFMDGRDHIMRRHILGGYFTNRRAASMRAGIEALTENLLDRLAAGPRPADLVTELALPLPTEVICDILGVPYEDHELFHHNVATIVSVGATAEEVGAAFERLRAYFEVLTSVKQRDPGDDLLSMLVVEQLDADGGLPREEVVDTAMLLLAAGHETTANMIALGVLVLLQDPARMELFRDGDDATVARGVDELLRYLSVVHSGLRRVAIEDIPIGGQTIRAGEGVVLPGEAANRDPSVYADADVVDLDRDAHQHLAFGYGPHHCIGRRIAEVQLRVVFRAVARRLPGLRLAADVESLRFKHDQAIYGVESLPVTW
jgi:cytochrome P450